MPSRRRHAAGRASPRRTAGRAAAVRRPEPAAPRYGPPAQATRCGERGTAMRTNAVIEAMETCRAMRYYKPDPVPDDLIETVLYAATRASSANNTQPWEFVVVRDAGQRARIAGAWERTRQAMGNMSLPDDPVSARTVRGV